MVCPRCEEGTIEKVLLRKNHEPALLCDFCGTFWYEHEEVKQTSGHSINAYNQGLDVEHTIEKAGEEDQDHGSIAYPKYK